jgi:hypothetical protein
MKEIKGKRGWEKPDMTNMNAPSRQGGWVARNLTGLLRSRDGKVPFPPFLCDALIYNCLSSKKLRCLLLQLWLKIIQP